MPMQKLQFTRKEEDERRTRLRQLQEIGVLVGSACESVTETNRFRVTQVRHLCGRVYDLPLNEVAVVLYANFEVSKNSVLISDSRLIVPWDDVPFELGDPEETLYCKQISDGLLQAPARFLNGWLTGELSSSRGRREGIIMATGCNPIPSTLHDETLVLLKLLVRDEQGELCFEFGAKVDRSLKREIERKSKERSDALLLKGRAGIWGPARSQLNRRENERLERLDMPRRDSQEVVERPPVLEAQRRKSGLIN